MQISVHDIVKRFGNNEVVANSTFAIEEGELFTLLGPSGCGKTTLLRLIAGFYAPDKGEVRFDGRNVNDMPPRERGIGMVFQSYALWPHMTVRDNVAYELKINNVASRELGQRVQAVLAKVNTSITNPLAINAFLSAAVGNLAIDDTWTEGELPPDDLAWEGNDDTPVEVIAVRGNTALADIRAMLKR